LLGFGIVLLTSKIDPPTIGNQYAP
jgi:hypothetical protein